MSTRDLNILDAHAIIVSHIIGSDKGILVNLWLLDHNTLRFSTDVIDRGIRTPTYSTYTNIIQAFKIAKLDETYTVDWTTIERVKEDEEVFEVELVKNI